MTEDDTPLYQKDAYLRSVKARVRRCDPFEDRYAVVLDKTVLYPEGGGQPSDHGTVDGVRVTELMRGKDGEVVHILARPVQGDVEVEVDFARRYDHMQQHTAQHILTATALRLHELRTTAFHLGPDSCDIELDIKDLPAAWIQELEEEVNARIRENLPVGIRWAERSELEALKVRSRRLPDNLEGLVRLVEIQGVDLNTCGGTHVARTGELQAVKLLSTQHLRGGTRLFYAAGNRVLKALDEAHEREQALNRLLSCGPSEHAGVVRKLLEDAQAARRDVRRRSIRLAEMLGRHLEEDGGVAFLHEEEKDMDFLTVCRIAAQERAPDRLLFLTGGGREGFFVVAGPAEAVKSLGPAVAEVMEGKGGGPSGVFQGKARRLDRRDEALVLMKKAVKG